VASLPAGCVRHTELFLAADPPTSEELEACARAVRELLADVAVDGARHAVGVAGTVTTLAALDLGLGDYDPDRIHGHVVSRAGLERQLERLAALRLEERRAVPALEPERAPVILAGLVVLREVLDRFGLDAVEASERDLLHGTALEAAELPEPAERDAPPGAYTCC
jgi:exopolyphosphatase/guanosine-5'-triphosphate,3'-diphosphate pyrophosphatase